MNTILVVDDDANARYFARVSLEDAGYRVLEAADGHEALNMIHRIPPDLVILDIVMPRLNGLEVCQRLRLDDDFRDLPILFLTVRDSTEHLLQGYEAGCDDYLNKPFGPVMLDPRTYEVRIHGRAQTLTSVEFQLLYQLMAHPGQVWSVHELLREVWGYPEGHGDAALVRAYIKRLREKLSPNGNPQFIQTVYPHGYTFRLPNGTLETAEPAAGHEAMAD